MLINSYETCIKTMNWAAHFFLNPPKRKSNQKSKFDFKSLQKAPKVEEMEAFNSDFIDLIKSVEFVNNRNNFQVELKRNVETINSESQYQC